MINKLRDLQVAYRNAMDGGLHPVDLPEIPQEVVLGVPGKQFYHTRAVRRYAFDLLNWLGIAVYNQHGERLRSGTRGQGDGAYTQTLPMVSPGWDEHGNPLRTDDVEEPREWITLDHCQALLEDVYGYTTQDMPTHVRIYADGLRWRGEQHLEMTEEEARQFLWRYLLWSLDLTG